MKIFHAVLKVLRDLWSSGSGLPPELERYCQKEGVDPWALAEAIRAEARESSPAPAPKKEAPKAAFSATRSPLSSVTN